MVIYKVESHRTYSGRAKQLEKQWIAQSSPLGRAL